MSRRHRRLSPAAVYGQHVASSSPPVFCSSLRPACRVIFTACLLERFTASMSRHLHRLSSAVVYSQHVTPSSPPVFCSGLRRACRAVIAACLLQSPLDAPSRASLSVTLFSCVIPQKWHCHCQLRFSFFVNYLLVEPTLAYLLLCGLTAILWPK